ncbi:MAG TPA: flagellar biosynthesis protein FlhB [Rhodospirillales bacterium]|nr:flagellar biosynthesis protein FlhB [Rhodospirillales bacterium]
MAEERKDQGEKTEQPTQRRLDEARRRGRVPSSREVSSLFLFAGALLLFGVGGRYGLPSLDHLLRIPFDAVREVGPGPSPTAAATAQALRTGLLLAAVPLFAMAVAALLASAVQNAIVWNTDAFVPKFERISPARGLSRIFSLRGLAELIKNIAKIAFAGLVAAIVLVPEIDRLEAIPALPLPAAVQHIAGLSLRLLLAMTVAVAVVAAADYAWQRADFLREMRMSRQELKDEHKETEGDPLVRQRLRALRMERARQRMMAEVPQSTVVITNPTHYAVALRYVPEETPAPKVVAKGTDLVALRIRELAREHGVPVVENPPLARLLHAGTEIGQFIPQAHYEAVAEVIATVMRLGKTPGRS